MELDHVLWIGGPPRSGKTTVATRLARRHGLRWYGSDTRTWDHRDRALAAGNPAAHRWEAMSPDERWLLPTAAEVAELTLVRERGEMILEDVGCLPASPLVVAEGSPLRPELLADRVPDPGRVVWLVPTPKLLCRRLEAAPLRGDVGDPLRARENEVERALLERAEIDREAQARGQPTVMVDESQSIEDLVAQVERLFAVALAAGPRAESAVERQRLLRSANEAVVTQVIAYHARPWARGDAGSVVRSFLCECGDPACTADVLIPVAHLRREPVLAAGHRPAATDP
jgi:hypothetical protein